MTSKHNNAEDGALQGGFARNKLKRWIFPHIMKRERERERYRNCELLGFISKGFV